MILQIKEEAKRREITRLCHFTQSRSLIHILSDSVGLLATGKLMQQGHKIYNPTDSLRYDGCLNDICCSVEYPNSWYFDKAKENNPAKEIFRDWVIVCIDPKYLWLKRTKFCYTNAAYQKGLHILGGFDAFKKMFAPSVIDIRTYKRGPKHLPCSPTNDQAEVLVPDQISKKDISSIIVASEKQAKNELSRLKHAQIDIASIRIIVAPTLYDKYKLSNMIREGKRPEEIVFC